VGTPTQGDGLGTFWFNAATGTAQNCVTAVETFMNGIDQVLTQDLSWVCENDVYSFDSGTGALTGITSTAVSPTFGQLSDNNNPPAVQGLLRLRTDTVISGRLLRGRLFIPGSTEANNDDGQPSATFKTAVDTAAAALIADANTDWIVYSRTHSSIATVVSGSTWNKWAQLRSRRD